MIKLINGRGQVGNILKKKISNLNIDDEVYIYHTWNIDDKTREVQFKEHEKFMKFVNQELGKRIIFISTSSQKDNWYTFYKHLSEAYLLSTNKNSVVVRLPSLIGKGTCAMFKNNTIEPFGVMELMSVEDAVDIILEKVTTPKVMNNYHIKGERVSAKMVQQLISFGENNG